MSHPITHTLGLSLISITICGSSYKPINPATAANSLFTYPASRGLLEYNITSLLVASFLQDVLHLYEFLALGHALSFCQLVHTANHEVPHSAHVALQAVNPFLGSQKQVVLLEAGDFRPKEGEAETVVFPGLLVLIKDPGVGGVGFEFGVGVDLEAGHGLVLVEHVVVVLADSAHEGDYVFKVLLLVAPVVLQLLLDKAVLALQLVAR